MAHRYHFKRHLVEARRNRRRLGVAIGIIALSAVVILVPSILTLAATSTTFDIDGAKISTTGGGTYGGDTTGEYSTATVIVSRVSSKASFSTNANPFAFTGMAAIAKGEQYSVTAAPTTIGSYSVKGLTWCADACTGYDPGSTNFQAGGSANLTVFPNHFYHIRWIYQPAIAPTPAPVTPVAAVPLGSTAPGSFQALVAGSNAQVSLSWTAPEGTVGVKSYKLERSIDKANWLVIDSQETAPSFIDDTVTFGVHYYYRLSAIDLVGHVSSFAVAEATTGAFTANSAGSNAGTFISDDQIASVYIPAGALDDSADCTVTASSAKVVIPGRTVVAGPYSLVCKGSTGEEVSEFNKPVTWHYSLTAKLNGYTNPSAVSVTSLGGVTGINGGAFNSNNNSYSFNQPTPSITAMTAAAVQGISPVWVITALFLTGIIAGVLILVVRKSQRADYHAYMRRKYFDL